MKMFTTLVLSLLIALGSVTTAQADIVAVTNGFFGGSAPSGIVTQSVTVGATADMLILMISDELGSGNPAMTVTYGGVNMNLAVGNLQHSSIWYLDLATNGISGTQVIVNMSGYTTRNGFAAGWVSIDGNLALNESIALHSVANSAAGTNALSLVTTTNTFNVVNFNGNGINGTITVNSPNPTVIYTDTDIGSARSAAAYEAWGPAGTSTYQWTLTGGTLPGDYRRIAAAAFSVVAIPEPSTLALVGAGFAILMGLRRRRR
jgi:hypothetical protein